MFFSCSTTEGKESHSYFCEVCDRIYASEKGLYLHELEHETCGRDGCQFSAHPKLVAKHVKAQHDTGLYKRIGKLDSEEGIAKWLEERKRKYPTKKVIEEKKKLQEEKIKRGERINEDKSRFNKSLMKKRGKRRKSSDGDGQKKDCKGRVRKRRKLEKQEKTVLEALEEEARLKSSVRPFKGIGKLYDNKAPVPAREVFSDAEWETSFESESTPKCTENVNGSLSLLASCYESDQDIRKSAQTSVVLRENVLSDDDIGPEEVKTERVKEEESTVVESNNDNKNIKKRTRRGKRGRTIYSGKENNLSPEKVEQCSKGKRKLTLLEKLLSKEIRHERNIILQCVRYVVQNNFFLDS